MASSMAGMYNSELTPSRRMTRDVSKEVAESARSETFFELLSTDLRLMSSESKKLEGFSHQFGGIFATKDEPNIKESCERALHRLRALTGVGRVQMEAVRESPDLAKPFHEACHSKVGKVVCVALNSFQKFVAHDGVTPQGVLEIIISLQEVEKMKDEAVQLRILQVSLAIIQNPMFSDEEDSIRILLGLVFRIYAGHKANPTVLSTAAATIRQAVALVFDHSVLPRTAVLASPTKPSKTHPAMLGREVVAHHLLVDIVYSAGGSPIVWLKTPPPSRTFLLDLLDSILMWRSEVFASIQPLQVSLKTKVCNLLDGLLTSALDPNVDPASLVDVRLVVRCCGALIRRHTALAPEKCAHFLQMLIRAAGPCSNPWQRMIVLQTLRQLCTEHVLVSRLFETYDLSMDHDLNAVTDMVKALSDIVFTLSQHETEHHEDDVMDHLPALYSQKAIGIDPASDLDGMGPVVPGADTIICYLALECLLGIVSGVEALTDMAHQGSSEDISTATALPPLGGGIKADVCTKLVDKLWRFLLLSFSAVMAATSEEPLFSVILKGYQQFCYSAGTLGAIIPRDGFLASLCEFTLTSESGQSHPPLAPPPPSGDGRPPKQPLVSKFSFFIYPHTMTKLLYTPANTASTATLILEGGGLALTSKNVAALRVLFNLAHRLNDCLGFSWIYVIDVINCLEQVLTSPYSSAQDRKLLDDLEDPVTDATGPINSELAILSSAVNQLFENTSLMSTSSVVALLSTLGEVSMRSLPQQARYGQAQLYSLNRMVDTLLRNHFRLQELWGLILAHVLELLRSPNPQVRASTLEALDRATTGALNRSAQLDGSSPRQRQVLISTTFGADVEDSKVEVQDESDIQDLVLAALDSLYREERESDVSRGLLKIVTHVLHHHGEELTRGWVPLMRLLEAVPQQAEPALITLGFQCVELVVSDFLPSMPKEYIPRTLNTVALFAKQEIILNVSLTAVTMVWSMSDQLARSSSKAQPARQQGSAQAVTHPDWKSGAVSSHPTLSSNLSLSTASSLLPTIVSTSRRMDISEEEVVEMLMTSFRALKQTSLDDRPEVRNSSVRTLFLAVGSHGSKLPGNTLREVMWEMLFPLVCHIHLLSYTSSCEEVQASELGREKSGKSVMMLMHHSRNTEQKQWDETLVLALNGTTKVLRAHLLALSALEGFQKSWEHVMQVMGDLLFAARRGVASAASSLITILITSMVTQPQMPPRMWRQAMQAIDKGVVTMASPNTHAPLQARCELVSSIGTIYALLREQMDEDDIKMILRWVDRFARYPVGLDDTTGLLSQLGPIQKATLAVASQLCPPASPAAWPHIMNTMCSLLCPFKVMKFRSLAPPPRPPGQLQHAASSLPHQLPSPPSSLLHAASARHYNPTPMPHTQSGGGPFRSPPTNQTGTTGVLAEDPILEARALSPMWMARICELVTGWFKDHVGWQVRVTTFPVLLSALADCMAMRHLHPKPPWEQLWQTASTCFISVVETGLPSITATAHGQGHLIPQDTWSLLVRAFRMFLSGHDLPSELDVLEPNVDVGGNNPLAFPAHPLSTPAQPLSSPAADRSTQSVKAGPSEDFQGMVLDCLSDSVLLMCHYAPQDMRQALIDIIDLGAAGPLLHGGEWGKASAHQEEGPPDGRFSHVCLSRLHVLCCRGQDTEQPREQSAKCQLEVAQLALPVFINRCEVVLQQFVQADAEVPPLSSPASNAVASPPAGPPPLVATTYTADRARLVLKLLMELQVVPSVTNHLVQHSHPQLRPWVEIARIHNGQDPSQPGIPRTSSFLQRTNSNSSVDSGFGGFGSLLGSAVGAPFSSPSGHPLTHPPTHTPGHPHPLTHPPTHTPGHPHPPTHLTSLGPRHSRQGSAVPGGGGTHKEQLHLIALYRVLCESVSVTDATVRDHVGVLLARVGVELGLCHGVVALPKGLMESAELDDVGDNETSGGKDGSCTLV